MISRFLSPYICAVVCLSPIFIVGSQADAQQIEFLDAELSKFEVWIGTPHTTVEGLPPGTSQHENFKKGEPLGLNNDPKNVFSIIEEDGKPVLRVTGEIYGGLTTLDSYSDYHLSVHFKWGEKKWEPRLKRKRDSGIVYHAHGRHGVHANAWKACLEYQVQESDIGDFIGLGGAKAKIPLALREKKNLPPTYDPESETIELTGRYTSASSDPELENGEWNHLEVYVVGNRAVHVVNGEIVLALHGAVNRRGEPLVSGQIQLQAEGAECFYRDMVLTPIADVEIPESVTERMENP